MTTQPKVVKLNKDEGPMTVEVKGGRLVISIDISPAALASAPLSSTGKSNLLYTSKGWERTGPVLFKLACIKPA